MSKMTITEVASKLSGMRTTLMDMEWRIFKEWQRVIPDEPFEAFGYKSILKRAKKEGINTDNLINAINE